MEAGGQTVAAGAVKSTTHYPPLTAHHPPPTTASSDRITIAELQALWEAGEQVVVLEARTERAFNNSPLQPRGVTRFIPTDVAAQARQLGLPHDAWLVAFCA